MQVNAYTGHSNKSHTTLTHYFHLDENWVGGVLAKGKEMPISAKAEATIERDNSEWQRIFHQGEEDSVEE